MERASSAAGMAEMSRPRGANLRMLALAGAVALVVVLPLAAASAGPAGPAGRERTGPGRVPADRARGGALRDGASAAASDPRPAGRALPLPGAQDANIAQCGPELSSPAGLEAQTCVLEQSHETWGRTYYRNATGGPLSGVLTLMAPDGSTVQAPCDMPASDDPGACETPHAASVRGHGSYAAVAEIASAKGNLLLRSGSNSPAAEADSPDLLP
ncbi:hypothetical protein LKL35_05665 [Streptomyces sp. ET3-23]|uniref:hypothetical protein n=1 Tax=Streptomyces sp. ET3-23 TaxID=2885643 RepID=UPI001D127679|nr:hypothetical protein [Streptomyces sp. ET3-23]MCC2274922.1 hypothetical protein [Streptomyces sp. ET3-23]